MPPYCAQHRTHHSFPGEHDAWLSETLAAQKDAERRDRAAEIAADVLAAQPKGHGFRGTLAPRILAALTAATLQALTEAEATR